MAKLSARLYGSDGRRVTDVVKMALPDGGTCQRVRVRRFGIFVAEAHTVTNQVGMTRAEPRPVVIDLGDSP